MHETDVLIVTALELERDAVQQAANWRDTRSSGVRRWETKDIENQPEYLLGEYALNQSRNMRVALACAVRKGGNFSSDLISALLVRLKPACLAMCGVCAGNPADSALGDVIIASSVFQYDEGKRTAHGFEGDIFSFPMDIVWLQRANDLRPEDLPSYGTATEGDASLWLLELLYVGADPTKHPARSRYFPAGSWKGRMKRMEDEGLIRRNRQHFLITAKGKEWVESQRAYDIDAPTTLPFSILTGPMASGNSVVKDGITWDMLKRNGQRSAIALDMEAASVGAAAYNQNFQKWIVIKGVMDHADPQKADRYKPFAAKASAEVLLRFLEQTADNIIDEDRPVLSSRPSDAAAFEHTSVRQPDNSSSDKFDARWLKVRENLTNELGEFNCAFLRVSGTVRWRSLIPDLVQYLRRPTSIVDLRDPEVKDETDFVKAILRKFGIDLQIPRPEDDLKILSRNLQKLDRPLIVLLNFDLILRWDKEYQYDLLTALAFLVGCGHVALLLQSRTPFDMIVSENHITSPLRAREVHLSFGDDAV